MSNQTNAQCSVSDLAQLNQVLRQLSLQVRDLFEQKKFREAQPIILQVLEIVPQHPIALMNLATVNLRLQHYAEAYRLFQQAKSVMGDDIQPFVYYGLTETCHFLNQQNDARYYGQLTIEMKKKLVASCASVAIPATAPPVFNPHQATENIISYSLFGDQPRYCEVAILNVQLAKEIYPEWTCRFYVDESVPQHVIRRFIEQGAQVVRVQSSKLLGFFWRFLVIADPTVKRFLIRDADSLLGYRERAAVDEWLHSDAWFHVMRDFYPHCELILAGMWGGCTGVFSNIHAQMITFIESHQQNIQRALDQDYLGQCIWPTISQSLLSHDSQQYDVDAVEFPTPQQLTAHEQRPFHIGANEGAHIVDLQLHHQPSEKVTWVLRNEQHQEICRYDVKTCYAMNIQLILPHDYATKIRNQVWYVESFPI